MPEKAQPFHAGIIDFNPKRMSLGEVATSGIPKKLREHLGDWRQYPLNISIHFPEGVSWFSSEQPWFYKLVMANEESVRQLEQSEVLILSGPGMSAYHFQERTEGIFKPEEIEHLGKARKLISDHLGKGRWALGICFGGQLALHAVGGKIGRLPDNATEAGWLEHELTANGEKDELMSILPKRFFAPHFHNDFVARLPRVGEKIQTGSGEIRVTRADVLAVRHGYLGKDGIEEQDREFIQTSVVEFDNGARLYQIQPHPEMATREKANFLVRMNQWLSKEAEMGDVYYQKALFVPDDADFSIAETIPRFVKLARRHLETKEKLTFKPTALASNLYQYLLK